MESALAEASDIVIHVRDENRGLDKDFKCSLNILLRHMKYFEKYLKDTSSPEEIDISVHCDVNIFEWLMQYISQKEAPNMVTGKQASAKPIRTALLPRCELCLVKATEARDWTQGDYRAI